jgi:hypothetical protein
MCFLLDFPDTLLSLPLLLLLPPSHFVRPSQVMPVAKAVADHPRVVAFFANKTEVELVRYNSINTAPTEHARKQYFGLFPADV